MAYNKYYLQKKQVSYDNGLSWEDVTPYETRQGEYIATYDTLAECETPDYSTQYLTFVAEADNMSVSLSYGNSNVFQYSVDSGTTWSSLTNNESTTSVNSGQTIMFKASGLTATSNDGIGSLNPSVYASVQGNIMSLVYGDNFTGQTTISAYRFKYLFSSCLNIISVENLILPATTLGMYCYQHMFSYLTRITTAPELPATTLASGCYRSMFANCSSLTVAPSLPATTLADNSYAYMFQNCSRLTSITCLATDISATNSTQNWVSGVSASGTFTKAASMSNWTLNSTSGIPSGWTVQDA